MQSQGKTHSMWGKLRSFGDVGLLGWGSVLCASLWAFLPECSIAPWSWPIGPQLYNHHCLQTLPCVLWRTDWLFIKTHCPLKWNSSSTPILWKTLGLLFHRAKGTSCWDNFLFCAAQGEQKIWTISVCSNGVRWGLVIYGCKDLAGGN